MSAIADKFVVSAWVEQTAPTVIQYLGQTFDMSADNIMPPITTKFTISNITCAQSIALQRTALDEMPCQRLEVMVKSADVSDPFIPLATLIRQIREICIRQHELGHYNGRQFTIDVENTSIGPLDVKCHAHLKEIMPNKNLRLVPTLCNNFHLVTLTPGKLIKIVMEVVEKSGVENGVYTNVSKYAATYADNLKISEAYYQVLAFNHVFRTTGTITPLEVMIRVCNSLIARLKSTRDYINNAIMGTDNPLVYTVLIPNETYTICNLIESEIKRDNKIITLINFNVGLNVRQATFNIMVRPSIDKPIEAITVELLRVIDLQIGIYIKGIANITATATAAAKKS